VRTPTASGVDADGVDPGDQDRTPTQGSAATPIKETIVG